MCRGATFKQGVDAGYRADRAQQYSRLASGGDGHSAAWWRAASGSRQDAQMAAPRWVHSVMKQGGCCAAHPKARCAGLLRWEDGELLDGTETEWEKELYKVPCRLIIAGDRMHSIRGWGRRRKPIIFVNSRPHHPRHRRERLTDVLAHDYICRPACSRQLASIDRKEKGSNGQARTEQTGSHEHLRSGAETQAGPGAAMP